MRDDSEQEPNATPIQACSLSSAGGCCLVLSGDGGLVYETRTPIFFLTAEPPSLRRTAAHT